MGGGRRADLFRVFGHAAVILRSENPFLNAQFAQSDLQDFEVGDLIHHRRGGAIVIVIVIVIGHAEVLSAASSHRSGISVCSVSLLGPV
jgi:hypothetical protein